MKPSLFEEALCYALKERSGGTLHIKRDWIAVNNRPKVRVLKLWQEETKLMPLVYPEDYESRYEEGERLEDLADEILAQVKETEQRQGIPEDFFQDYEAISKGIFCRVINVNKNKELLSQVPHEIHEDLAIVYFYELSENWMEEATILIRNEHLKMWNRSVCEIRAKAWKNTLEKKKVRFRKLSQVLLDYGMMESPELEENPLYLLTNEDGGFGAAVAFYPQVLSECARIMGGNLVLLPSSIHEWLLLPYGEQGDNCHPEELRCMVREINRTQLAEKEVLSDEIYYYDLGLDRMSKI